MANIRILMLTLMSMQISGENILAVFPSDVKSHFTLGKIVLTELANRGHEVCAYSTYLYNELDCMLLQITFFSQFTLREKHENITEIRLAGAKDSLASKGLEEENHLTARYERSKIDSLTNLINRATALVDYTLEYPVLQGNFLFYLIQLYW